MKIWRPYISIMRPQWDRRVGVMVDKRRHETMPTIDIYLWWTGIMIYWGILYERKS